MPITFSCENCDSSFTVDSKLAGRTARCRKCNHRMTIPAAEFARQPALAAAGSRPASAAASARKSNVGAAAALRESAGEAASQPIGWLDAVNSQIALKPVTMMAAPAVRRRDLEEPEDDGRSQYKVVIPRELRKKSAVVTKPAELAAAAYQEGIWSYRQFFNLFAILFRRINEMAYGISLIFLNVAIVGAIMSKHSIVVMGISMVVLLNVIQLAAGVANLIAIHFRGNLARGLLFLFPPVTVYYLWTNSNRYKKAIGRITSPIIWLVVVTVAYSYIPWLNGSKKGKLDRKGAIQSIIKDVEGTVSDFGKKGSELKDKLTDEIDNSKLSETANDLKSKAQKVIDSNKPTEPPNKNP